MLAGAVARLALPMHIATRRSHAAGFPQVHRMLEDVSIDLDRAASAMEAAELVALRGATVDPRDPLAAIDGIPNAVDYVRRALSVLQDAREGVEDAYDHVGLCRGHLRSALHLLNYPDLPGMDVFLDAERGNARHNLETALELAEQSAEQATDARMSVRP